MGAERNDTMKTTKDYEIEISRNNVSAAEFLAYLRRMKKTHPEMASDFDLEYFRAGDDWNPEYHNGVPGIRPASAEIVKNHPYDKQTYCRWFDGTTYNEIIEWECDDATTGKGHGYYYTVQLSVADEDSAANTAEELTKTAHRLTEKAAGLSKQSLLMRQYIATSREYLDGALVRLHSDEAEMWQREADECRRNAALCIKEAAKTAAEVQTETITENETTKEDDTMTTETTTNTETTTTEPENVTADPTVEQIAETITATRPRSAWGRGVKTYALELLDNLADSIGGGWEDPGVVSSSALLHRALLNGAQNWQEYSEGGCALIYDGDIAERLCNATELRRTHGGALDPNSRESWIDCQSRALFQAERLILDAAGLC